MLGYFAALVYCRVLASRDTRRITVTSRIPTAARPLLLAACALLAACHPFSMFHRNREARFQSGPEIMYTQAHKALIAQSFEEAIKLYEALESRFPFSESAHQAQLDLIYAYYKSNQTDSALDAADTFIRENPTNPRSDYAYYMKGLVSFARQANMIERFFNADLTKRPPNDARKSFDSFAALIQRYPQSIYAPDARQRMIYLRNRLADFDLHVAEYYMKRGAYVAAMNRARYVVENYDGAPAVQPSLAILIDAYRALKMNDLAANAETVYKANYSDVQPIKEEARKKHWWNIF
jgi:outer membrane protein assembly factor BamD